MWTKVNAGVNTSPISDPLKGLKVAFFGSSSTNDGFGFRMYYEWIAERSGITPVEFADAGTYLTCPSGIPEGASNQLIRIDEIAADGTFGMVLGMIGTNDDRTGMTLGTFGDTTLTTYYGALAAMCDKLLTKFPGKPIGIMTANYSDPNTEIFDNPYQNATIKVCQYYGIPVFDTIKESRLPYHHSWTKTTYVQADGLHLTEEGNRILSYPIESFMRKLIGQ